MNIFIIHRSTDNKMCKTIKQYIQDNCPHANVLVLTGTSKIWKPEARILIKKADVALFLVGKDSFGRETIGWEIEQCLKRNKVIFCVDLKQYDDLKENEPIGPLSIEHTKYVENYPLHEKLKEKNSFNQEKQFSSLVKKIGNIDEFVNIVNKHIVGEYEIFNEKINEIDSLTLIEQYKSYLGTSETLVARRQSISSFYITVNGALITIASVASPFLNNLTAIFATIIGISIFGIILCFFWRQTLESYGRLNSSKMAVITLLERKLPAKLFEKEWEILVDKLNNKKYVSFTDSERRIPLVFSIVYTLAFVVGLTFLILILCGII